MFNKIKPISWGLVLLLLSVTGSAATLTPVAKSEYGSYIVIMSLDPVITYDGNVAGYEATKPAKGKKVNPKSEKVKKYKKKLQDEHDTLIASYGLQGNRVHDYSMAINGFSARMSWEQAK